MNFSLRGTDELVHPQVRVGEAGILSWPRAIITSNVSPEVIVAMTEHALTVGGATPPAKPERH